MSNYTRVFADDHYYFITVVIGNRKLSLLTDHVDKLKQAFKLSKKQFNYEIYAIVIMPDHFHMIINPQHTSDYPLIVSSIKREFTKLLDSKLKTELAKNLSKSQIKHRESGVWQRRYFEHTIRTQESLNHLTDYIHFNPVKHGLSKCVHDWKYSSFRRFVEKGYYSIDWCDFSEDIDYD